ncbi:MAG: 3-keto-5-aminohexanoate cleavage protein, partial [Promethearchaeota archaeon]
MPNNTSNKLIITAALSGASTTREQNPAIPHTAEEFGHEEFAQNADELTGSILEGGT